MIFPRVSSEKRSFIPIDFIDQNTIASDACLVVPNATLYHFGVLMSTMDMAWVRSTFGRLKSDFRYCADIVYNNFRWPENPSAEHVGAIEAAAQVVLDARAALAGSSLAQLCDPLLMPPQLLEAHKALDKAVDTAYKHHHRASKQTALTLKTDAQHVAYLFDL